MLRCLIVFLAAVSAYGQSFIWPEQIGTFQRVSTTDAPAADRALWTEYGFEAGERAEYSFDSQRLIATGYRLKDSTGALALYQAVRPAGARRSDAGEFAVESGGTLLMAVGNYVVQFDGSRPPAKVLQQVVAGLPRLREAPLPLLPAYLPAGRFVPGSERYALGPVALERFEPRIPAGAAGFDFGAEAQLAKYRVLGGEVVLAIFSYPTPHIARAQLAQFQQVPGIEAKRTGPMVALALYTAGNSQEGAQKLLESVNYEADVTMNQAVPGPTQQDAAEMVLSIFALAGLLLLLCLTGGLLVGLARIAAWKFGNENAQGEMIVLNLSDRSNSLRSKG